MKLSPDDAAAAICAAVVDVLEIERADPRDNFIELGGNSLLAVILANRIEEDFGTRLEIEDIFAFELHYLARRLREALS